MRVKSAQLEDSKDAAAERNVEARVSRELLVTLLAKLTMKMPARVGALRGLTGTSGGKHRPQRRVQTARSDLIPRLPKVRTTISWLAKRAQKTGTGMKHQPKRARKIIASNVQRGPSAEKVHLRAPS